jgi:carbamoyl-phosphate synthase large subunit
MEYLPFQEYSVYVFCNNGNMLYCIPNKREELLQYYSFRASIVENKQICNICKKIVKILGLDFNVNLQFKISANNIPKLIEINPRIGGTIILPTVAGVNLPYLAIKKALDEKFPTKKSIKKITMIRYWKELFANGEKSFEIDGNYKKTF